MPEDTSPAFVRVDNHDPPEFSCAVCGWTRACSGTAAPLFWSVIEHWLTEHWAAAVAEASAR